MRRFLRIHHIMSKALIARRGIYFTGIVILFQSLVQIGALSVLARFVSPEEFGVANAAMLLVALGANLFEGGVALNIAQRESISPSDEATAFWVALCLGIIILLSVNLTSNAIASFLSNENIKNVIQVISLSFLLLGLSAVGEARLYHRSQYRLLLLIGVIPYAIGYAATSIALAIQGLGYWALIYGYLGMLVLRVILIWLFAPHKIILKPNLFQIKEHLYKTLAFSMSRFATYITNQGDKIIISRVLGLESLGIYGRAHQLMMIPNKLFVRGVVRVTTPLYASIKFDISRVCKAFYKSIRLTNYTLIPLVVYIISFRSEIVKVILGPNWLAASNILGLLAVAGYFHAAYKIPLSLLNSQGLAINSAICQSIFAVILLLFVYIFAKNGLLVISCLVTGVVALNYLFLSFYIMKIIKANLVFYLKCHFFPFMLGGLYFMILYIFRPLLIDRFGGILSLLIGGILMAIIILLPIKKFLFSKT